MKRSTTLLSAAALGVLALAFSTPLAATDAYRVTGVASNDTLNIRSGPRANSARLGDVAPGQSLQVMGYDATGRWAIVSLNGQQAFVSMQFLTMRTPGPITASSLGMNQVTGIRANDPDGGLVIRNGPGVTNSRLFVIPNGVSFDVVEISADGKWSRGVFSDGGTGWARNSYLRPTSSAPATPTPPPPPPPSGNTSFPSVYSVVNVAPGQVLWVRNAPNAGSPPVTNLAPNAAVSVLSMLSNGWAKVTIGQNIGYVNANFLTQGGGTTTSTGMQLGITCSGTEPFWALNIATDGSMSFEAMGGSGPVASTLQTANPMSGGTYPIRFTGSSGVNGVISAQTCSDGMSDISYPWNILFSPPTNGNMQVLRGCCTLQ